MAFSLMPTKRAHSFTGRSSTSRYQSTSCHRVGSDAKAERSATLSITASE